MAVKLTSYKVTNLKNYIEKTRNKDYISLKIVTKMGKLVASLLGVPFARLFDRLRCNFKHQVLEKQKGSYLPKKSHPSVLQSWSDLVGN